MEGRRGFTWGAKGRKALVFSRMLESGGNCSKMTQGIREIFVRTLMRIVEMDELVTSHGCDKIPNKSNLKDILAHSSKVQFIMAGAWDSWSPCVHSQEAESGSGAWPTLSTQSGPQPTE